MKTSSIKNTTAGLMLFFGVAIQIVLPALPANDSNNIQKCNQKLITKLEHQISKIQLPMGLTLLNRETQYIKGK